MNGDEKEIKNQIQQYKKKLEDGKKDNKINLNGFVNQSIYYNY